MLATREQMHNILDVIDSKELGVLYQVLIKFIPEDYPMSDEIEAILAGRQEIDRGEFINHDDINWD